LPAVRGGLFRRIDPMTKMFEVRWHGRGGQGAKTASNILAQSALSLGKFVQAMPEFGAERGGAPVVAYTRISDKPIRIHYGIRNPQVVVVLDDTLIGQVDVAEGLAPEGSIIVNTRMTPQQVREKLRVKGAYVYCLDATKIALETIKRAIPNTPMLGAFLKVTRLLDIEAFKQDVRKKFSALYRPEVVEGNLMAIERAYQEVVGE